MEALIDFKVKVNLQYPEKNVSGQRGKPTINSIRMPPISAHRAEKLTSWKVKRKKILPPPLSFLPDENNVAAKVPKASTRKY